MEPTHRNARAVLILMLVLSSVALRAQTGSSSWVRVGTDGRLQYTPDSKGHVLPDYSTVGYRSGDQAIPSVAVVKTLTALSGDNLAQIQAAINEVSSRSPDAAGFRGAILLKAGQYNVSNSLSINASGVVLRGEGNTTTGTRMVATRTAQHTLINIAGSGTPVEITGTRKRITDTFVPIGSKSFTVESAVGFAVGDEIILRVEPKEAWITLLDMAQYGWTASAFNMNYHRTITKIDGNKITLNAPVVDPIDTNLKTGFIYKFTWAKIENIGIENIRFSSVFTGTEDENHAWTAISIDKARHCWVRNSNFYHFGYSAVMVQEWGINVSVLNCQNLEPISITTGGRKYSFNVNGQFVLVKDCYTNGGRHDYVTGSTTAGPNAFVNCQADNMKADIGPHHRWATGLLFDNVTGSGEQNVQNRGPSGTGHGWAGAQTLFWNCTGSRFRNQMPPQHRNWAIGCKGIVTDDGNWVDGNPGIWESTGNFIGGIQSLYEKQLQDRQSTTPPPCAPAIASADDGNIAANVLDGNLATRWSANGDGQWIQFCLETEKAVRGLKIAFYKGNERASRFDVLTSTDGLTFTSAASGLVSSGTSLSLETFTFPVKTAKFVRVVGHGNNINTWNSFTEVEMIIEIPNVAPSVNITSPSNNTAYTAPATVTINGDAVDTDGTIAKVEFFQGAQKLGEDLSSPYTFVWSGVSQGSYILTAKATDDDAAVTTSAGVSITVNPPSLPSPWQNRDIGAVSSAGSASHDNGTFTVNASGADIWGTADEFHLVHQPLTGDGEIRAHVNSLTNTNAWAKAGVMVRETLDANATHASIYVSPVNGISFQKRIGTGATTTSTTIAGTAPVWLKMNRSGNLFTASSSADGVTWTIVGTATVDMPPNAHVGLALTSHADGTLATGVFSDVSVSSGQPCAPPVASADDGNVAANVIDNNFATRWSASGDPQWIQLCLDQSSLVSGVQIAFYKGNERSSRFDVLVSTDGNTFNTAATGLNSSGTTLALETFTFPAIQAKHVRIVGHGNNLNLWNSYTEVRITTSPASSRTGNSGTVPIAGVDSEGTDLFNYPNPANDRVTITYTVKKTGKVKLAIYNAVNSQSIILSDEDQEAGTYCKTFDISGLASGMHIVTLIANSETISRKLLKQ